MCCLRRKRHQYHNDLINIHGGRAVSYSTVSRWVSLFKVGRECVEDDPRSGCLVTKTKNPKIELIEKLIEEDPHITYDNVKIMISFSRDTVERIFHDHLNLRKVASKWIPNRLRSENKKKWLDFVKVLLEQL